MSYVPFVPASDRNMARIAEALESTSGDPSLAEIYDNTSTYGVGKYVKHDGILYKCTTAITTAEPWTAAHWREVKLANETSEVNEKLGNTNLPTTAQTVTGAIDEHESDLTSVNDKIGTLSDLKTSSKTNLVSASNSLFDNIAKLREAMTYVVDGNQSARAIPAGAYFQLVNSTISGRSDGAYTASQAIPANTAIDSTYFTQTAPIAAGALNDAVSALPIIKSGVYQVIAVAGTYTAATISFGYTFPAAPVVVANIRASVTPHTEIDGPNIPTIGTENFSIRIYNSYSSDLPIYITWIAIYQQ